MTCGPDEWVLTGKDKETLQQLHPNFDDVRLSGNSNTYVKRPKTLEDGN